MNLKRERERENENIFGNKDDNEKEETGIEDIDNEEKESVKIEEDVRYNADDSTILNLYRDYKDGKIILQPIYQRGYVWSNKQATRFIESIYKNIPLPSIYFYKKGRVGEVIDGQQRLTTLFTFLKVKDVFNRVKKEGRKLDKKDIDSCTINGCKFTKTTKSSYAELDRKTIVEMEEIKCGDANIADIICGGKIRCISIEETRGLDICEIFNRLNTGASRLTLTEIRNCIFNGEHLSTIKSLAEDERFKNFLRKDKKDFKKKENLNVAIKYFALEEKIYKYPLKRFIDEFLGEKKKMFEKSSESEKEEYIKEMKKKFNDAIDKLYIIYGDNPILRYVKNDDSGVCVYNKKVNCNFIIFLMIALGSYRKNQVEQVKDCLKDKIDRFQIEDEKFSRMVEGGSNTSKEKIDYSLKCVKENIEKIMSETLKTPRLFTYEVKKKLWDQNIDKICPYCHNKMDKIEDCVIDHIDPYHNGGTTTEDNAQIMHKWCNLRKSGKVD